MEPGFSQSRPDHCEDLLQRVPRLNYQQAAAILEVSIRHVRRLVKQGTLLSTGCGHDKGILATEISQYAGWPLPERADACTVDRSKKPLSSDQGHG
jgi:hypothetical protein